MWNIFRKWFTRRQSPIQNPKKNGGRRTGAKPTVEVLEDRLAPTVTSVFNGPVSLSVGAIVNVSQLANNQQEETIAANPTVPGNLIAASNDAVSGNPNDIVWFSNDNGTTWTQRTIPNLPARGPAGDPTVVFNRFGLAVYAHLDGGGIAAAVSTDGGNSWNAFNVDANGADDKEFIAVGPDFSNLAQDRFYVGWQRGK
ncbi:MAG: exo-alpha-sialidase [Planctomycetes bacterium]|nr:exo-alpha-sialidase [Planctomycetota bacterium]